MSVDEVLDWNDVLDAVLVAEDTKS